jgi:hypothetical protein
VDCEPPEPILFEFETDEAPFEFSFHLSGHTRYCVTHQKGKNRFNGSPGLNVAAAFSQSYATMEVFDCAAIRMVAIQIEPCFFRQYLDAHKDLGLPDLMELLQKERLPFYLRPSTMTPSMSIVANQILTCPYHGLAKQLFYESKTLELMVLQLSQLSTCPSGTAPETAFKTN